MSGWIKIDKDLTETIRFRRVTRKLRDTSNALRGVTAVSDAFAVTLVLGALVRFWQYADSHIGDDNTLDITFDEINEVVGIDGFAQTLPAEWLQVLDAERVQLPNFLEHNGSSEKQRRDNARRQADYRHRHKPSKVTRDVTPSNARNDARPEKTREEKTREEPKNARADVPRGTGDDFEFIAILRAKYPPGSAREDWITGERNARNLVDNDLATWADLTAGVERYAARCRATGQPVLNPANFFGAADRPWAAAHTIPAGPKRENASDRIERALSELSGGQVIEGEVVHDRRIARG